MKINPSAIFFLLVLMLSSVPQSSSALTVDFSFQLTNGENVNISNYEGKPILLEWGASWCSICKQNQESMQKIYTEYKDRVQFISLSYGGSGDSLQDVDDVKRARGYQWDFGLDTNDYAATVDVANGYNWLISEDLKILRTWNYTIVTSTAFANSFIEFFDFNDTIATEDELIIDEGSLAFPIGIIGSLGILVAIPIFRRKF
jgi:thiol-disulfide isomerase/thioredoxin